uniref:Uncharacterized protein n=1 Tax=Oryza brachyantha TaxID=4533 RepID=J3KUR3_ORYBR
MGSKLAMQSQMLQVVELAHPLKVVAAAAKCNRNIQLVISCIHPKWKSRMMYNMALN